METMVTVIAFPMLAIAWTIVAVAIVRGVARPAGPWRWLRGLPLVVQLLAWLLALPVVLALWIWQTGWALPVRALLVLGLALVSLNVMAPWNR